MPSAEMLSVLVPRTVVPKTLLTIPTSKYKQMVFGVFWKRDVNSKTLSQAQSPIFVFKKIICNFVF